MKISRSRNYRSFSCNPSSTKSRGIFAVLALCLVVLSSISFDLSKVKVNTNNEDTEHNTISSNGTGGNIKNETHRVMLLRRETTPSKADYGQGHHHSNAQTLRDHLIIHEEGTELDSPHIKKWSQSPDPIANFPSCPCIRYTLSSENRIDGSESHMLFNESYPSILSGWNPPAIQKWSNMEAFEQSFGKFAQYVRGNDMQAFRDKIGNVCVTSTKTLMRSMDQRLHNLDELSNESSHQQASSSQNLLFITSDSENPSFFEVLSRDYSPPNPLSDLSTFVNGVNIFSAAEYGSSHPIVFPSKGATWLGQVSGSMILFLLPPGSNDGTMQANGCDYVMGHSPLPKGSTACVQNSGQVMYIPPAWNHATCVLEPWSLVVGQGGNSNFHNQHFGKPLTGPSDIKLSSKNSKLKELHELLECSVKENYEIKKMQSTEKNATNNERFGNPPKKNKTTNQNNWTWYDGDLNEYYNKLERDEHAKRNPKDIKSYAVHRWLGPHYSTLIHYQLVREAIYELVIGRYLAPPLRMNSSSIEDNHHDTAVVQQLRVFDAGCGLGAGLMWFEEHEPRWELVGHTISDDQFKWITEDLPMHKFKVRLLTYDEPFGDDKNESAPKFDAIYSIEAAIHSPNYNTTLRAWSDALVPGGVIVIIDDFLSVGVSHDDPDVSLFSRSWIAHSVFSTIEVGVMGEQFGLTLVRDRDLGSEFQVIKRNYRNKVPKLKDERGRNHQGWLGSKVRQRLMVQGKITYRLIVLQKV